MMKIYFGKSKGELQSEFKEENLHLISSHTFNGFCSLLRYPWVSNIDYVKKCCMKWLVRYTRTLFWFLEVKLLLIKVIVSYRPWLRFKRRKRRGHPSPYPEAQHLHCFLLPSGCRGHVWLVEANKGGLHWARKDNGK